MAHVRDEVAFGQVGFLGLFLCQLQVAFHLLLLRNVDRDGQQGAPLAARMGGDGVGNPYHPAVPVDVALLDRGRLAGLTHPGQYLARGAAVLGIGAGNLVCAEQLCSARTWPSRTSFTNAKARKPSAPATPPSGTGLSAPPANATTSPEASSAAAAPGATATSQSLVVSTTSRRPSSHMPNPACSTPRRARSSAMARPSAIRAIRL